jgi:hypothetical protein
MGKALFGFVVGVVLCAALASPAPAADASADRVAGLKAEIVAARNAGRLAIANLTACASITGYAAYVRLPQARVARDGTLAIYYEPENWFTTVKDGRYGLEMLQDIVLIDAAGREVFRKTGALTIRHETASPILDLYVYNNLDVSGLPAGRYNLPDRAPRQAKEGAATADLHFVIAP